MNKKNKLLLAGDWAPQKREVANLPIKNTLIFNLEGPILSDGMYYLIPYPPERKVIDIGDYYSDFKLITKELGWKPKVNLLKGLEKTLSYYQLHQTQYWND